MRTLKKVLALTVVLATLLSISAFAAFSDEESINENFVEAVNLLGALNVMTGDTEGTFRPNDTIMRSEAAKMIYVIRNGGVDDKAAGWTGMSTFSDVPAGAWYEGYVNYCASLGIIAGVGGGKFNPDGAVTGVELAKMLLVVANYKPEVEGYTGTGWNLNVIRDAQTAGMFKGYTLAYSAAATRQQAAQLFSNAILETQMAIYIGDTRVNDLAAIANNNIINTIGGLYFNLRTSTGILTKIQHVNFNINTVADLNANDELSAITSFGNANWTDAVFEFAADPDLLYQEVDVIYREDTEDPGVLSRDVKVYAVLSTGNSYVYDTTMDAITIELKDDSMAGQPNSAAANYNPVTIQFEGYNGGRAKVLPNNFTLPVIFNLYEGVFFDADAAANRAATAAWDRDVWVLNDHDIEMVATNSTAPIRLIDYDRDGELDIAFVTTPYYGTVASYNADRYEFTTNATIDGDNITTGRRQAEFENFTFEDDLEKDDVIAINIDVTSGEVLYTVSLVEPTVGDVTYVYSTDPDNEVVIGGETYGFYGLLFDGKYLDDPTVNLSADDYNAAYEDEVTVYTDGKYIISAEVDPADLGNKFAFVKNYNLQGNSFDLMPTDSQAILIELVLPNGTTVVKEYDREEVSSSTVNFYEDNEIAAELPGMLGNIVEYSTSGNYVAIRKVYNTAENDPDLAPNYYDNENVARVFTFNSKTGVFTAAGNVSIDVNDESVLFLPTYKDGVTKATLQQGDITDVDVILGANLRGEPTVTTDANHDPHSMQMVSCLQDGVNTVAFAALDANSTISDAGVFAYALTNDWDKDDGEEDAQQVRAVLSNSGSDEGAVVDLNNSGILANKIYRAVLDNDGDYTFEEIVNGETVGNATIMFGSIRGRNGNNVSINGNVFHVTAETVIFVVDIDARGSMTRINLGDVSDLTTANLVNGAYRTNVLFETDPQNELTVVYVEAVGDDLTPVINYGAVSGTVTIDVPAAQDGQTVAQFEDELEAAILAAMPKAGSVSFSNWKLNNAAANTTDTINNADTWSVDVTVAPNAGVAFDDALNVDGATNVDVNNDGELEFTLGDTAGAAMITVDDIATPFVLPTVAVNTELPTTLTGAVANANVGNIVWNAAGQAAAGNTYVGKFSVTAKDADHAFAEGFTLGLANTATTTVTETRKSDTQIEVTLTVTLPEAEDTAITTVSLILAAVEHGDDVSSKTANVTGAGVVEVTSTATATFTGAADPENVVAGEKLTVEVRLTADTGYVFTDATAVTFSDPAYTDVQTTSFGNSLVVSAKTVVAMAVNPDTRVVDTEEELTAALANNDVKNIIISGDITLTDDTTYDIRKKVNISGESGASITCAYTAEGPDSGVFTFWPGSEGSVLRDLTINFTSAKRDSAAVFLTNTFGVADSTETTIENVKFIGADELENVGQESAIITASSAQGTVSVKNCSITNFKYGMYFNNAENLEVTGNTIDGTLYNGIMVDTAVEGHDVKVNNNTMRNISHANYNDAFYSSGISFGKTVTTKECTGNNITMLNSKTEIYEQPVA